MGIDSLIRLVRGAMLAAFLGFATGSTWAADAGDADYELTVRQGDTLIGIGKRLLVDPNSWPEVQRRNNIQNPQRLVPGSIIVIPRPMLRVEPAEVVVRAVSGQANKSDGTPVAQGERLAEGAAIRTADNGYVTIQLVDGSTLRMQSRSDLKLERARRVAGTGVTDTQIEMRAGQAEVKFTPAVPKASRFEIRTGFASAAVRGTGFRVAAGERGTRTEVVEGTIAFAGIPAGGGAPSAADTVAVSEGFGSFVDDTRKPIPPVQLLGAPALPRPQVVQLAPNLRLRIPRIAGAVSYRAQLATDAELQQVRYEVVSAQPDIVFTNIEVGSYVLQVRAIDKYGLEGRDGRVPVTILPGKPQTAGLADMPGAAAAK